MSDRYLAFMSLVLLKAFRELSSGAQPLPLPASPRRRPPFPGIPCRLQTLLACATPVPEDDAEDLLT